MGVGTYVKHLAYQHILPVRFCAPQWRYKRYINFVHYYLKGIYKVSKHYLNLFHLASYIIICFQVLYGVDIISGTLFIYTHHILIAVGLMHCFILPITLCSTSLRYRQTSKRLINTIMGRKTAPSKYRASHIKPATMLQLTYDRQGQEL